MEIEAHDTDAHLVQALGDALTTSDENTSPNVGDSMSDSDDDLGGGYKWMEKVVGIAQHERHRDGRDYATEALKHARKLQQIPFQRISRSMNDELQAAIKNHEHSKTARVSKKRKTSPSTSIRSAASPSSESEQPPTQKPKWDTHKIVTWFIRHNCTLKSTDDIVEESGYSLRTLRRKLKTFKEGHLPDSKRGRKRKCSKQASQSLKALARGKADKATFMNNVMMLSYKEHMLSPNKDKQWTPPSATTIWRLHRELRVDEHKAQPETPARMNACSDIRTFITLYAAFRAADKLYGRKNERSGLGKCDPANVFNFDQSTGTTFNVDFKVMNEKGAKPVKVQLKQVLKQQYNIIFGVGATGAKLPPLIGIKAKSTSRVKVPLLPVILLLLRLLLLLLGRSATLLHSARLAHCRIVREICRYPTCGRRLSCEG